jgi:NAD(P)-dependent dehydrogenase (short-subunit alcohol dehydrogenase family)
MDDVLSYYKDRPVLVTGCASGIGGATAQKLFAGGAHVIGVDKNEPTEGVHEFHSTDLGDESSINATLAKIEGPIWGVFNCAGLSGGTGDQQRVFRVNFLGLRALTEGVLDRMPAGSAIASTASGAGQAFETNKDRVIEVVRTKGFAEGKAWAEANESYVLERGGYPLSKEALILYSLSRCMELGENGTRINVVAPGVTDTPMLIDSARAYGDEFFRVPPKPFNRRSTAEEQANILIFLNSGWASYVNGQTIWSDGGGRNTQVLPPLK